VKCQSSSSNILDPSYTRYLNEYKQVMMRHVLIHFLGANLHYHHPPPPSLLQVLSLGFLMTSYLKWCGLTEAEVSLYRGVGALTGLLATFIFPGMSRKIGKDNGNRSSGY
jgi:MFS-type transporter involved in bile tolerance (Atg22 family)